MCGTLSAEIPLSAVGSLYYHQYKRILRFTLVHSGRWAGQATHPPFSLPSCPRFNNGSGNRILGNRNIWCIVSSSGLPLSWERPPGVFLIYRWHTLPLVFTLPSCSAPSGISHLLKVALSFWRGFSSNPIALPDLGTQSKAFFIACGVYSIRAL